MSKKKKPDLSVVQGSLEDPPIAGKPDAVSAAAQNKGETRRRRTGEIFPNAPVTAIGVDGDNVVMLDVLQQIVASNNLTRFQLSRIFGGNIPLLREQFPSKSSFDQEGANAAIIAACTELGVVDLQQRVRETGAWPDIDGDLIWHCGDQVLGRGERGGDNWQPPGLIGEHVYPAKPRAPRPADCTDEDCYYAASELLAVLETWHWQRGTLDARLMLGWVAAGMVGGALDWRPMGWTTGDAATGKSTLQKLIHAVAGGDTGMVVSTDASEAGIRQLLMMSTRPVWLDEAEAEADNRKMDAVVKLARQASSGGQVLRGGAEHKGATFRVRSAMMFSSILMPPMKDQDLSRLVVFKLRAHEDGATPPRIDPAHWAGIGARLRRAIWTRWHELHEFLEHYRAGLAEAGHDGRGADQFGILLALADLVTWVDEPHGDVSEPYVNALAADIVRTDIGRAADWERCMLHLFSQRLDIHRQGAKGTVGEWILTAAGIDGDHRETCGEDAKAAQRQLRRFGLNVSGAGHQHALVEIANDHVELRRLFADTAWGGGVHRQAVERIDGWSVPEKSGRTWAGVAVRVSHFPLASVIQPPTKNPLTE